MFKIKNKILIKVLYLLIICFENQLNQNINNNDLMNRILFSIKNNSKKKI